MTAKTREKLNTGYRIMFWSMSALSVVLCSAYVYFMNGTIQNVVARSKIEKKVGAISSTIDNLETSYVSKKQNITLGLAKSLGFKQISNVTFVGSKMQSKEVTMNN